jgi:polyisoprenyl-teichoic acid--peptidoglycan teichoic acid transferase
VTEVSTSPSPETPRSGAFAGFLSAIVPGWGHAYLGRRGSAFGFLLVDLLLVASALVVVARFQLEAVKAWVSPAWLLGIMAGNIALLAYRAFASGTAFRAGSRREPASRALPAVAAALVLLVVPHVAVGYLAWTQYDLITTVFQPSPPVAGGTTTTSSNPASTDTVPGTTVPTTTTTTLPPRIWDGVERLNIALLGSDMRPNQETLDPDDRRYVGHRTDVMIVMSINPQPPYDVALFSVPRFLSNYELPEGMGVPMSLDEWDWIGHVYRRAEDIAPDRYPGPGSPGENAVKAALGELFGIDIHHYALITVRGFIEVIDALGGVTLDVPRRIVDRNYDTADDHWGATRTTIVIESGRQHLDGYHALAYARIRSQSHEFARMQRQRCIIAALVEQTNPIELLFNLGSIAQAIKDNVTTDIPQDALADFVDLLPNLDTENFTTLNIDRSAYEIPAPNRLIRYFDIEQIREDAQFIMGDPVAARAALGLSGLDTTCEESLDP